MTDTLWHIVGAIAIVIGLGPVLSFLAYMVLSGDYPWLEFIVGIIRLAFYAAFFTGLVALGIYGVTR